MARNLPRAVLALTVGLAGTGLLGGCGSQTKTVSVGGSPGTSLATQATQATAPATTSTAAPVAPATTSTAGGTAAPTSTRSAPAPAFTHQEAQVEGLATAAAALRAHGYTPADTSEYHPGQTLRVLVGTRSPSGDGYGQQAFFFVDGHFIGTDAKEPSASVKVLSQSDTEVTLAYPLYRPSDPLCCPGGGQATVRFQLNDGRLSALDQIPPAHSTSTTSRY